MSSVSRLIRNRAVLVGVAAAAALAGAGLALRHAPRADAQAPAAANAAIPVTVRTIEPENVRIWSEFSGRLHAVDSADIRPEVNGRVVEVRFRDGQTVKAGDVLFVIDPRPYEATVAKAEANLVSAVANAGYSKTEFDRAARLIKTQAVAQSAYEQRANADRMAQAAVQMAEADLRQAKIDLDHAYVKAPISGRVSRAEVTLGNLVEAGPNAPVLTSIVSDDGIYADFEVDEQTYISSIRAHAATHDEEKRIPVELSVDGDGRAYKGTISSFDNRIDVASGTIRARARFANDDRSLVPGMFVSVRLAGSSDATALLAPVRAIGSNQSKKFVYVADGDNKVAYREVALGQQVDGGRRIVRSGLRAGDRLIVDGLQHVRPGATVEVREAEAGNAADSMASK
jgi:multidrug efflux system membrane fusion protein